MNKDFLNLIREIRGAGAPGETYTDGIWYELTMADTNGNPGVYGDILAKYGIVVENTSTLDQAVAIIDGLTVVANSLNEGEAPTAELTGTTLTLGIPVGATGNQGSIGLKGSTGDTGPIGPIGPAGKDGADGVDGHTPTEAELDVIVSNNVNVQAAQTLVADAIAQAESEVSAVADDKINEFNNNADNKTTQYDDNHTTKLSEYDNNDTLKTDQYNANATTKVTDFNEAYADRIADLLNTSRILGMIDKFAAKKPTQHATFLSTDDGSYLYYLNGVRIIEGVDFTVLNTTVIELTNPIEANDVVTQVNSKYIGDYIAAEGALTTDVIGVSDGVAGLDDSAKIFIENLVDSDIKTLYESNVDTNAYTDIEKSKLGGVETGATADQTGAEIKALYELESNTNAYTDIEKAKVANVPADTEQELLDLENTKQDNLVSGINIKSINGESLVGAGDLTIAAGSGGFAAALYLSDDTNVINSSYKTLSYIPDAASTLPTIVCSSGETAGDVYLFDLPIDTTVIDAGRWTFNFYAGVNSVNGDTRLRVEPFMRAANGVETTLFSSTSPEINNTVAEYIEWETTQPVFNVDSTAVYGIRVFASTTSNSSKTVTYTLGDGNATFTNTPLATRHDQLRARDKADSHPIEAITGLRDELDLKLDKDSSGNVTVPGNLIVTGTNTTVNSDETVVKDPLITLNAGEVGAGVTAGSAGFEVDRGTEASFELKFDESDDKLKAGLSGNLKNVAFVEDVEAHVSLTNNPHSVSKAQVGLSDVDNTSDLAKPVSTAAQAELDKKADLSGAVFTGTVAVDNGQVFLGSLGGTPYPSVLFRDPDTAELHKIRLDGPNDKLTYQVGNSGPLNELYHEGNVGTVADFEAALI